jgi:very-short-patch-repair endonuclease
VKFRRQHPIGPVVVDFCCPKLRLIVEIDGPIHQQQRERDAMRQRLLEDRGYHLLRLRAEDVERDLPSAVERIVANVQERTHENSPSPTLGEGAGG